MNGSYITFLTEIIKINIKRKFKAKNSDRPMKRHELHEHDLLNVRLLEN